MPRCFRHQRKVFIISGLILCVACFWFLKPNSTRQLQSRIENLGGTTRLDIYCGPEATPIPPMLSNLELTFRLKEFFFQPFHKIVYAQLRFCEIADSDLTVLEEMNHVIRLDLSDSDASDKTIESISRMRSLKYLDTSNTQITQAGVARLLHRNPSLTIEGFNPREQYLSERMDQLFKEIEEGTQSENPELKPFESRLELIFR